MNDVVLPLQMLCDRSSAGYNKDACVKPEFQSQGTVFVHPAHVEAAVKAGLPTEAMARNVVRSLVAAFRAGMLYGQAGSEG